MNNFDRRAFMAACSSLGLGSTLFPGVLWGMMNPQAPTPAQRPAPAAPAAATEAQPPRPSTPLGVTRQMVEEAMQVAGVKFDDTQIDQMLRTLSDRLRSFEQVWSLRLPNDVPPALMFDPVLPGMKFETQKRPLRWSRIAAPGVPKNIEDLAFATVRQQAELLRTKKISATALAEMYLDRIKRYDPVLHFAITVLTDRALAQAKEADRDIAAGRYRGALHGIPWGAKDLLAVKGARTTWGAAGFEDQKIDEDATVVQRLDKAGAVLLMKTTLGALAQGDVWFGATTRNPWKVDQGSSGSSAGSSSATAAGCIAFGIGSETLGSISSPSDRCGATGFRPTFGRVPRTGAMALSWSMDKLGPICRNVEDGALVFNAIYGPDGHDRTVHELPFNWDADLPLSSLRIGYLKKDFEQPLTPEQLERMTVEQKKLFEEAMQRNHAALGIIQSKLNIKLIPVEFPTTPSAQALRTLLTAEAAAAFDELTRSGRDKLLTAQGPNDWPNTFRAARFIPAVEYINENRARTVLMREVAKVFDRVDVIVAPTAASQLTITNLTGHPAVILPNGFRQSDGTPTSLTFLGQLFGEAKLARVAKAYQDATDFHLKHPTIPTEPTPPFLPQPPQQRSSLEPWHLDADLLVDV